MNVTEKILRAHLVSGEPVVGQEVGIRIDQTLTQDATGTMAYLQFESMGIDRAKTELSVSYVDHNTVQIGFENADDHDYLQSVAKKYGIVYSKPGNGICHQLHLERFGRHRRGRGDGRRPLLHRLAEGRRHPPDGPPEPGRLGQGRHPRRAAPLRLQGERREGLRVLRARPGDARRAQPRDHREHGRRARRHHLRLPLRRRHPRLPQGPGPRAGLGAADGGRRDLRRDLGAGPLHARAPRRRAPQPRQHRDHRRARGPARQPDHDRLLHELLLPRHQDRGVAPQGQAGPPRRGGRHRVRLQAGGADAR